MNELANFGDKVCVKQLTPDIEVVGWPPIINGAYRVRCVEVLNIDEEFAEEPWWCSGFGVFIVPVVDDVVVVVSKEPNIVVGEDDYTVVFLARIVDCPSREDDVFDA